METFSQKLLHWFDRHGRHELPWRRGSAYAVWVSEIMLQQTQVSTVIPYYRNFMQRFPDLAALAAAPIDAVLYHWAGLGYYARARNLHRAARQMVAHHNGRFPTEFAHVIALAGVGRSTAGAILAFCFQQRWPILDGNVKRILARYFAIDGYPGTKPVQDQLWALADRLTPENRVADYTQAMMDLGATVCVRSNPVCPACPLHGACRAYRTGRVDRFPQRKPERAKPQRSAVMTIIFNRRRQILLQRRPSEGIWGGLWSLPQIDTTATGPAAGGEEGKLVAWCRSELGLQVRVERTLAPIRHHFTHYALAISPVLLSLRRAGNPPAAPDRLWYEPTGPAEVGLPAPVAKLLRRL